MLKSQLPTTPSVNAIEIHHRLAALTCCFCLWHRNTRTRRQLRTLNHKHLADIGLSEADRTTECQKWFWQN